MSVTHTSSAFDIVQFYNDLHDKMRDNKNLEGGTQVFEAGALTLLGKIAHELEQIREQKAEA